MLLAFLVVQEFNYIGKKIANTIINLSKVEGHSNLHVCVCVAVCMKLFYGRIHWFYYLSKDCTYIMFIKYLFKSQFGCFTLSVEVFKQFTPKGYILIH